MVIIKIFAFSDWRIQSLETLVDLITEHRPDAILYAGDDLNRFAIRGDHILLKTTKNLLKLEYPKLASIDNTHDEFVTEEFREEIKQLTSINKNSIVLKGVYGIPFYLVNGNDDFVFRTDDAYYTKIHNGMIRCNGERYWLAEKNNKMDFVTINNFSHEIRDVHSGIYVPIDMGFGKFVLPNETHPVSVFGFKCGFGLNSKIKNKPRAYADIFLSHIPPMGVLDLSARYGARHIGSEPLLELIEKHQPKIVICGHSHLWGGSAKKVGETVVLNVSSHDSWNSCGNYALIDTEDWSFELKTTNREVAHPIKTIRGFSTIRAEVKRKRLTHVVGFHIPPYSNSEECLERLNHIEECGVKTHRVRKRIESLRWDKPMIERRITIDPKKHAFVDVETGRFGKNSYGEFEPGQLWLIGVGYKGKIKQFLIPEQEKQFLSYIKKNKIRSFVSWTRYDALALRPLLGEKAG
ncbi:MAG: metallophosphoesterase, partial [Methanosarcinales archaeon]|nr:metallophosphoesterase [Methanosarcinales archaeon]